MFLKFFCGFHNLFPIAPHFNPNPLPWVLLFQLKWGIKTYSFWECWKIDFIFVWWANEINDFFLVKICNFAVKKKSQHGQRNFLKIFSKG
jgi:hypothetical protein